MDCDKPMLDDRDQYAMHILGRRWMWAILRLLLIKPSHFCELRNDIGSISEKILSIRLKELSQEGIIERDMGACTPTRAGYRLTEKGRSLAPVIEALVAWSEQWIDIDPPITSAWQPEDLRAGCSQAPIQLTVDEPERDCAQPC